MACNMTLAGIAKDCAASMGGVKAVYLALKDSISGITTASDKITAITMASGAKFYAYAFRPSTAAMQSTRNVDHANGVNYVETTLSLVFNRMETAKRVEIEALAHSEVVALVRDNNNALWYLGYDEPVIISAGEGGTGTARSDRNGYAITLTDSSHALPYEVLEGEGGVDVSALVG